MTALQRFYLPQELRTGYHLTLSICTPVLGDASDWLNPASGLTPPGSKVHPQSLPSDEAGGSGPLLL